MMFWCFHCSKRIFPTTNMKCQLCQGQAIEEIHQAASSTIHPANFIPYQIPPAQVQTQEHPEDDSTAFQELLADWLLIRHMQQLMRNGPVIVIRWGIVGNQAEQVSVPQEKIDSFRKVQVLSQQCAICQEGGKGGMELPCKHQFHQNCIRPWLSCKNTCPCCRATLS